MTSLLPLLRWWYVAAIGVLGILAWHFDSRAVANANTVRVQAAQFAQAQRDADAQWQKKINDQKALDHAAAVEDQNEYTTQISAARASAAAYIAAHSRPVGVQPTAAQGGSIATPAATQTGSTSVPASVPVDSVMVSPGDVQACTDAVTYALKAHDWAMGPN